MLTFTLLALLAVLIFGYLDTDKDLDRAIRTMEGLAGFDERQGKPCWCDEPDNELNEDKKHLVGIHKPWCDDARSFFKEEHDHEAPEENQ